MSPDPASSCLTCRKRQVKCDGARPTCTRCPKDERVCRGYKGQIRIVHVDPAKKRQSLVLERPKRPPDRALACNMKLPPHIFVSDRDCWTIMDCTMYWNRHVIPQTFPVERPFYRVFIKADAINSQPLPQVCLHAIILAFRSTQAAKLLIDPRSQPDLCYYRGLTLRELPQYLETATTDPSGVALISIIMFMASELLLPDSSWLAHLDAARRITLMRGGMTACRRGLPDATFVLVQWYIVETLTSATANSASLPAVEDHEAIGEIRGMDFQVITCACACPLDLLQMIARINCVRRMLFDGAVLTDGLDAQTPVDREFQKLLATLEGFDCNKWAAKMPTLGFAHPIAEAQVAPCSSVEGLISIAECFRSAAVVYLLLSCDPDSKCSREKVVRASHALHSELDRLFDVASDNCDAPLDTQMWKFATWPLVIAAYAWVGWDLGAPHVDSETLYARIKKIAAVKGTLVRSGAKASMRDVQVRRAKRPYIKWRWDMGFSSRQSFVL